MNETKYVGGERIKVGPNPHENGDRVHIGKLGTVERYTHTNGVDEVYSVDLDGETYAVLLYGRDLEIAVEEPELTLLERAAKLEAELAEVKRQIENENQQEVVSRFPIGSAVRFTDNVVIKVGENKWHWLYIGTADEFQHHSNSDDKAVVKEQREFRELGRSFTIHRADRD